MTDSPAVSLSLDVRLDWPGFALAVEHDLELDGITGLFGPSGGGKTTLLRIIAGLERGAAGRVRFGGECWQDSAGGRHVPAYRRPVGYVFQDARLFAHLTVAGNLRYASARVRDDARRVPDDEIVAAFDLEPLLARQVHGLSGGERQRVAIARTLMAGPRLLLLDEPLAALDVRRKAEILPYLEDLSRRFGVPAIYVSHAVDEVARLAERVIVLEGGRVRTTGAAADVLSRVGEESGGLPFEAATILEAEVRGHLDDLHLTRLDHRGQSLVIPRRPRLEAGDTVRLHVRAGDVALATERPAGLSFRNVLEGTLSGIEPWPDSAFARVAIDVGGTVLKAHLTRQAIRELALDVGMPVYALLKTAAFDVRA